MADQYKTTYDVYLNGKGNAVMTVLSNNDYVKQHYNDMTTSEQYITVTPIYSGRFVDYSTLDFGNSSRMLLNSERTTTSRDNILQAVSTASDLWDKIVRGISNTIGTSKYGLQLRSHIFTSVTPDPVESDDYTKNPFVECRSIVTRTFTNALGKEQHEVEIHDVKVQVGKYLLEYIGYAWIKSRSDLQCMTGLLLAVPYSVLINKGVGYGQQFGAYKERIGGAVADTYGEAYTDAITNISSQPWRDYELVRYSNTGNYERQMASEYRYDENSPFLLVSASQYYFKRYRMEGFGTELDYRQQIYDALATQHGLDPDPAPTGDTITGDTCYFLISNDNTVAINTNIDGVHGDEIIIHNNAFPPDPDDPDPDLPDPDDPNPPKPPNPDPDDPNPPANTGSGLLTTSYAMERSNLQALGQTLWNTSFIDNIHLVNNSPIENIVSCKMFPFSVSGTTASVKLGNVDMGVNGKKCNNSLTLDGGTVAISRSYNNYMDFEPYTKITIYIPFIGYKELQPSLVVGKTVALKYVCDLTTGTLLAILKVNNVPYATYNAQIGIDIPITSNNRAQVELGYISSALGMVTSFASGNAIGMVASGLNAVSQQYHSETSGHSSPVTSFYNVMTAYVIIDKPTYTIPTKYGETVGYVCNRSLVLGALSGFTVVDNVNLSNIPCYQSERDEIMSYLQSGVIL